MNKVLIKFQEGGPFFTYTIFVVLIIILALLVKAFLNKDDNSKNISLIASFSWFAIAWGYLGRTMGMIVAFDNVSAHGELTPRLLADGLKMAILGPLFAIIVFLIARAGIIILIWKQKKAVKN